MIDEKKLERMSSGEGFIAALDQSGGRTPRTLRDYGIPDSTYHSKEEMYDLIHDMRKRILMSPEFTSHHILGAIIFEDAMKRQVEGLYTADYLWQKKHILPFLSIDEGLLPKENGVQLMKDIPNLEEKVLDAKEHHVFGTKQRSFIQHANEEGIKAVVAQQFELAKKVFQLGLIPTIEPEIDIHAKDKAQAEEILKQAIIAELNVLPKEVKILLKLSLPSKPDYYRELMDYEQVVRLVALSGGFSRAEADQKLAENHGMIASFSRALLEDLSYQETDFEFDLYLHQAIDQIDEASRI